MSEQARYSSRLWVGTVMVGTVIDVILYEAKRALLREQIAVIAETGLSSGNSFAICVRVTASSPRHSPMT